MALRRFPRRFCFSERHVRFGVMNTRPHGHAEDLLARMFGAFLAFLAQLHAGLVLVERAKGAMTFEHAVYRRNSRFTST